MSILPPQFPPCTTCHGRRHVRLPDGQWSRCACLIPLVNIKPVVRAGEFKYPPEYDTHPPYPLRDLTLGGGDVR